MKKIILILLFFSMVVFAAGCAGSNIDTVKQVESEAISAGTAQPNNLTTLYQDVEWENNVAGKVDPMFKAPLANMISSINNRDYISMQSAGTDIAYVASYILAESKKYNVSPQHQTRKNECEAGWMDMKKAGDYFVSGAKKMQAGDNYGGTLDIDTAVNYSSSAGNHLTIADDSGVPTGTNSGVIASWSGSSTKNTETFHVPSKEWKISWDTHPGQYGDMNFQIYVYNSNGSLKNVAANVIGSSSDYSIIRDSGDYYLMINTAQPYKITVESLN